ncbi:MAG TPA: hypothetical protein VIJ75_18980 [Hanamia sp.]
MTPSQLLTNYPLDNGIRNYFFETMVAVKNELSTVVAQKMNMQLPEQVLSQACQTFFYIGMDLDKLLAPQYQPLVNIVSNHFRKALQDLETNLVEIMRHSFQRGIPKDDLLPYIACYIEEAHKRNFPTQPIILG